MGKKRLILDFLTYSKLYKLFKPFYGGLGIIVALHRTIPKVVNYKYINEDIELSPEELVKSIKYYKEHGYTPISINEIYDILIGRKKVNKFVAFTVDDGYYDNYTYTYNIFKKYDIPFTLNLSTGIPDKSIIMWWYILEDLLLKHDRINIVINNQDKLFRCRTPSEKYHVFLEMRQYILDSDRDTYLVKLREMFEPHKIDLYSKTDELGISWETIREMASDPKVTIASHTVHHRPFDKLSPEKIKWEITRSIERLEQQIGKKVEHFSYPFGRIGEKGVEIVKELGLKTATTTWFSNVFMEHQEHLECLPRIFKIDDMPKVKYLGVITSGAYAAMRHRLKRIIV